MIVDLARLVARKDPELAKAYELCDEDTRRQFVRGSRAAVQRTGQFALSVRDQWRPTHGAGIRRRHDLRWSEILERIEIPEREDIGALRIRTVAVNDRPCAGFPFQDASGAYEAGVVLDFDYSVLMPRRS